MWGPHYSLRIKDNTLSSTLESPIMQDGLNDTSVCHPNTSCSSHLSFSVRDTHQNLCMQIYQGAIS
eukprot:c30661_g1_i1 orf=212-409(-)